MWCLPRTRIRPAAALGVPGQAQSRHVSGLRRLARGAWVCDGADQGRLSWRCRVPVVGSATDGALRRDKQEADTAQLGRPCARPRRSRPHPSRRDNGRRGSSPTRPTPSSLRSCGARLKRGSLSFSRALIPPAASAWCLSHYATLSAWLVPRPEMFCTLQDVPAREGEGVDLIAMVVALHRTPAAEEDGPSPFQILVWDGTGFGGPDDLRLLQGLSSIGRALCVNASPTPFFPALPRPSAGPGLAPHRPHARYRRRAARRGIGPRPGRCSPSPCGRGTMSMPCAL